MLKKLLVYTWAVIIHPCVLVVEEEGGKGEWGRGGERTTHKKFSEWKQAYVGMEPSKTNLLDGNDTPTRSHHPYILCHFAAAYTNTLCVFVQSVVEGSVVGSARL